MTKLLLSSFDSRLSPAEEAMLDRLEAEWLARQQAIEFECFDLWTPKQALAVQPTAH